MTSDDLESTPKILDVTEFDDIYQARPGETYLRIARYAYGDDYIDVEFDDGSVYRYTYQRAGEDNVEHMKDLARSVDGLNAFINSNVKYDYESSW